MNTHLNPEYWKSCLSPQMYTKSFEIVKNFLLFTFTQVCYYWGYRKEMWRLTPQDNYEYEKIKKGSAV